MSERRMILRAAFIVLAASATNAATLRAQEPRPSERRPGAAASGALAPLSGQPPIRRIESASAVSTEPLGGFSQLHELSGGRVLLNDAPRRRLVIFDSTMKLVATVLDSAAGAENTYGARAGRLLSWRGDSALFIDPSSYAMLVIDPEGAVVRVRAVWRGNDIYYVTDGSGVAVPAMAGPDAKGRLVYRIEARAGRPAVAPPRGVPWFPSPPDSGFIVAFDLESRTLDTLASMRTPKNLYSFTRTASGNFTIIQTQNPVPISDDWALLRDGTVAIVRSRDYSVEYLRADGTRDTSAKLPFPWVRLTDSMKVALVDSIRATSQRFNDYRHATEMIRWANQENRGKYPPGYTIPAGYTLQMGNPRGWVLPAGLSYPGAYIFGCAPGEEAKMIDSSATSRGRPSCIPQPTLFVSDGRASPPPTVRKVQVIDSHELPDYRPPLDRLGLTLADAEGNLWVRTVPPRPVPGGFVYDVISRDGKLVDRIQVPVGYAVAGFGKGRVVYLAMRDAKGMHLARVRLR